MGHPATAYHCHEGMTTSLTSAIWLPRTTNRFRVSLDLPGFDPSMIESIMLPSAPSQRGWISYILPDAPFGAFLFWLRGGAAMEATVEVLGSMGLVLQTIRLKGVRPIVIDSPEVLDRSAPLQVWREKLHFEVDGIEWLAPPSR